MEIRNTICLMCTSKYVFLVDAFAFNTAASHRTRLSGVPSCLSLTTPLGNCYCVSTGVKLSEPRAWTPHNLLYRILYYRPKRALPACSRNTRVALATPCAAPQLRQHLHNHCGTHKHEHVCMTPAVVEQINRGGPNSFRHRCQEKIYEVYFPIKRVLKGK